MSIPDGASIIAGSPLEISSLLVPLATLMRGTRRGSCWRGSACWSCSRQVFRIGGVDGRGLQHHAVYVDGTLKSGSRRAISSRTRRSSWERPTANTGMSTLPRLVIVSLMMLESRPFAVEAVHRDVVPPPYVLSMKSVSRRGKWVCAGSKSRVKPNLMSPL